MNQGMSIRLIFIILLCTVWVIFIPGYVAYKHDVFYGWMFKDKIPDALIVSRIKPEDALKNYQDGVLLADSNKVNTTITFAGFAESGLNYVWLESYIILCTYIFLMHYSFSKKLIGKQVLLLALFLIVLFHSSSWIRNSSEFGKQGRTIYTFVNYDIDKASFWLQELRGYIFFFLMAVFWYQFELKRRASYTMISRFTKKPTPAGLVELTKNTKIYFSNWQRDIFISTLLFLPWTWFYWRYIYFHGDNRYVFAAIMFHSFWLISIILISLPFLIVSFNFWKLRMRLVLRLTRDKDNIELTAFLQHLEPIPRGQFLTTSITTIFSLISPFLHFGVSSG